MSFSGNRASGAYTPLVVSGNSPPRGEPISLATLDRDCFIIPLASLERFLPAGVPVSYLGKIDLAFAQIEFALALPAKTQEKTAKEARRTFMMRFALAFAR